MKKAILLLVILLAAAVVSTSLTIRPKKPVSQNTDDAIHVGAVLSLSGMGAADGEPVRDGIELARKDLSQKGIIVDVEYQDDATDPKGDISGVQYFVSKDVVGVIGFTWDFLYSAASSALTQEKLVGITATNTSEYTNKSPYGFYMAPKTAQAHDELADFLIEHKVKKIAFIAGKYPWSEAHLKNLKAAAQTAGAEIVVEEWFGLDDGADTVISLMPKIKEANPDMIFAILAGDKVLNTLFTRMQQYEMTVPLVAGTTSMSRYVRDNPDVMKSGYPVYLLSPNVSDSFAKKFRVEFNREPGEYSEIAYDALHVLVTAHQEAVRLGLPLRDVLSDGNWKGYSQSYQFDENNDVTHGRWKIIELNK